MSLRVALLAVLGPALSACECVGVPMTPQTFFAKRKFASLTNHISLVDRRGHEFAYVKSSLVNWADPLGFPGASLFLTSPQVQKQALRGSSAGDKLVATMASNVEKNELMMRDCNGVNVGEVKGQDIYEDGILGAHFTTKETPVEDSIVIRDLGRPSMPMVKLTMSQPCSPFPPYCSKMGGKGWALFGNGWESNGWESSIVQVGYGQRLATGDLQIQMTNNAATDMRFLSLFSTYQFSNTRWSPLMGLVLIALPALFVLGCCCCCYCCAKRTQAPRPSSPVSKEEETKLIEDYTTSPANKSVFACCTRRGGRTIGVTGSQPK